ncbi:MAG: hypothetical protein IJ055_03600 [Oscillospiraceae bacterium]|nr:hypothetical protein [Oscillospiraceae bacterium]
MMYTQSDDEDDTARTFPLQRAAAGGLRTAAGAHALPTASEPVQSTARDLR